MGASFSNLFGRVFAIRQKRPSLENPTVHALVSHSLSKSMLTISSQHIAIAGQDPDITMAARIPDTDPDDDSSGHVLQEHARTALTFITPLVESIPVAGPALKAAACGLHEFLNAADVGSYASV